MVEWSLSSVVVTHSFDCTPVIASVERPAGSVVIVDETGLIVVCNDVKGVVDPPKSVGQTTTCVP